MFIGNKKRLSCRKEIRLSEEELKQLQENADREGVKESQYLRMLITNRPRDYPEIRDEIARLSNEINHIGVNINQIAHRVNSGIYQEEDRHRLYVFLGQVKGLLKELIDKI
ncbi:plasmid mobilization protein [Mediterraneibacter faecis]|uniref:plasmid mobilization protein n=1 Tax=Bacillota TaxID=1239 RepID=UPI003A4D2D6D